MPPAPLPSDEVARLAALRELRVLDTPRAPAFGDLVSLASRIAGVPMALVSLIDADRQGFLAATGLGVTEVSREQSICAYTIRQREPLVIGDATQDARTSDNPLVTGEPGVRFYAGFPLVIASGHAVGTLCVLDTRPHALSAAQLEQLSSLARVCTGLLESWSASLAAERSSEVALHAEQLSGVGGWSFDAERNELTWTPNTYRIFGLEVDEPIGVESAVGLYAEEDRPRIAEAFRRALEHGEAYDITLDIVTRSGERRRARSIGEPIFRDGRIVRVSGSIQDITEQVRERAELERATRILEQTERVSGVGGWSYRVDSDELYWSPQVRRLHEVADGHTPTVLSAIDFYAPASRPVIQRAMERAISAREPFDLELEIITARGRVIPVRAVGEPVVEHGRVVEIAGSFQDLTVLREREQELHRSHTVLRAITDASTDVIFVKDREGRVLFANPAYRKALGRSGAGPARSGEYALFDAASREQIIENDRRVIETNSPVRAEERITLPGDQRERVFLTEKHPYRSADGSVIGVIGVGRDVTEYRRALDEIETHKERLGFALSAAGVGFWDHDLTTDRVYYADTWYTMLGYEPGELPMTPVVFWEMLLHPDDRDRLRRAHQDFIEGVSGSYHEQIRLLRKDGRWQWIADIGRIIERDANGRAMRTVGVHVDIDEQQRAQARLQTALISAKEGLWEWSVADNVCYFDEQWYRILGFEPGELPAAFETWESLCHPDDLPRCKRALGEYIAGRTAAYSVEHRLWTKCGRWKWVLGSCVTTERDTEGRPLRVVGVNIDIDDQRQAAEELAEALVQAESANAAKSQFLANMSHEIRTPMNAVLGYAELLLADDDAMDDDARRDAYLTIHRNGRHLLELINDILDLSKVEAGSMSLEQLETRPGELLSDVHRLMSVRAESKGIRFEVDPASRVPETLSTDPVRVRQILVNLIGNAIKFTEQGGVTISAREGATGASLIIDVADTGIGINDEHLSRLFVPFQQADSSMSRRFGGTGLGLSISRRLAQLLGGDILVRSQPGQGSVFSLVLPLSSSEPVRWVNITESADAPAEENAVAVAPRAAIRGRILLAEDGVDNQRLITFHLERAGAEVHLARNGREAIEALLQAADRGRPFDLVLMDMQMPEMDGYTAAREIRGFGIEVPVVALTAHAMAGDRERCLEAGCDDYVSKPVTRATLLETVKRWTTRDEAGGSLAA